VHILVILDFLMILDCDEGFDLAADRDGKSSAIVGCVLLSFRSEPTVCGVSGDAKARPIRFKRRAANIAHTISR
jgi:hypothetical protein